MIGIDGLLRRERAVIAAALLAITLLAWIYLWQGAGMGMSALAMTRATLFPHLAPDMPGEMPAALPLVTAMWLVMMVAMMLPSASPLILLYGRVLRARLPAAGAGVPTLFLAAGYLLAWLGFSLAAALVQVALQPAGLISPMMLWSKSAWLSAAVLVAAGLYQWSPLKQQCLAQCRMPVRFLTQHWRPGRFGALMLGVHHGAYCVGCCWLLMALLFVGGIMNLVWIAALTVLVLVEKLAPQGIAIGRYTGIVLVLWGSITLIV